MTDRTRRVIADTVLKGNAWFNVGAGMASVWRQTLGDAAFHFALVGVTVVTWWVLGRVDRFLDAKILKAEADRDFAEAAWTVFERQLQNGQVGISLDATPPRSTTRKH